MLTVDRLCKRITLHMLGGKVIEACRQVSFHVPQGGFLGLAGPSGAGKSTVLKCIYRTYLASEGAIRYNSAQLGPVDLARLPERGSASPIVMKEDRRRDIEAHLAQQKRIRLVMINDDMKRVTVHKRGSVGE